MTSSGLMLRRHSLLLLTNSIRRWTFVWPDAAALPLCDASADLAIAFMSLHDIDAMPAAVREVARVLEPGGRFCLAIVDPINSAGHFETTAADAPFVIKGDYLRTFNYSDTVEHD